MGETGWGITFVLGLLTAGTVVVSVVSWQLLKTWQIKIRARMAVVGHGAGGGPSERGFMAQRDATDEQRSLASAPVSVGAAEGGR